MQRKTIMPDASDKITTPAFFLSFPNCSFAIRQAKLPCLDFLCFLFSVTERYPNASMGELSTAIFTGLRLATQIVIPIIVKVRKKIKG